MNFKFNISSDDKDYYEFNKFSLFKSHHGKRNMLYIRLYIAIFGVIFFSVINGESMAYPIWKSIIAIIIFLVIVELLIHPVMCVFLKLHIKLSPDAGKKLYSSSSIMEFYDDEFTEKTPDHSETRKYSAVERAYVTDKMIYIYINHIIAYLIPISAFESGEQCNDFIAFLKSKGIQVF